MKKWATALMIVTLVFSLMACGGESTESGEDVSANETISENSEVAESETEDAEATTEETEETDEQESLSADSVSENGETVSADSITVANTNLEQDDSVTTEPPVVTNENDTNDTENNSGNADNATENTNDNVGNADAATENTNGNAENADAATGNTNGNADVATENTNNSANVESTTNDGSSDSTETSANTSAPVPLGYGDDLTYSGSITLPSGLTIRTLNQFNYAGMPTVDGNSWMGDIYSDIVAQNYETMADNFDAFNAMYNGSVINVTNGEQIWWRSSMADMSPSLELRKCGDHYKIIIWGPLLDNATAQAMGWAGMDAAGEAEAREALTVLLSTISSTPTILQESIIASLYTAPDGQEPIDANGAWTRIGDCQIRVDWDNCSNSRSIWTFCIKP